MATVHIPTQMRRLTGGRDRVEVPGSTLRQVVEALDEQWPGLKHEIVDADGLRPQLAVAIDGAIAESGLVAAVGVDAEIFFIPAIGGGAAPRRSSRQGA